MSVDILSGGLILEDKEEGVWTVIEPYLDADVLEEVSIPCDKFDFSVGKLYLFVIWTVYEGIEFYSVF